MTEGNQSPKKSDKIGNYDRLGWLRERGLIKTLEVRNEKGQVIGTSEVVLYPELLNAAHEEGLTSIKTVMVQHPDQYNGNTAIFTARVQLGSKSFSGTGDANPENVSPEIVKHYIRAAETRAKARALRDALNIPIVAAEELGIELANGTVLMGQTKLRAPNGQPVPKSNGRKRKPKEDKGGEPEAATTAVRPRIPDISPPANNHNHKPRETQPKPQDNAEYMTDRQRKYLFHLLANQNLYGNQAHEYLKKVFKVQSLNDVTKSQARELIDRLVKEAKELEEVPF